MAQARDAAAGIADRLKAFVDSPVLFRARYARGEERLPDGGHVLRFAQGKFPAEWSRSQADTVRFAAETFIRQFCMREGADHYEVLCAQRDANAEAIKENYHLLMGLLHPDRQDGRGQWPEECAQRVNAAYATLGEAGSRREYDLRLSPHPGPSHVHRDAAPRFRPNDARFARALLAVSLAMAGLVVVLLMVHEDDWGDRTLMDSAIAALRSNPPRAADRPRYVGASLEPARATDSVEAYDPPFAFIEPLMARLRGEEPAAWAPSPTIVAPRGSPPAGNARVAATGQAAVAPAVAEAAPQLRVVAQLDSHPATAGAPSAPASASSDATLTNDDIEKLIVALIVHYEAGDVDRLLGLVDGAQAGYWRTAQIRQAYADFFRATRARRLRVESLAWSTHAGSAAAKGEATITAEYFDQSTPVERRVPVEVDVAVRQGRPLITRLALFPLPR